MNKNFINLLKDFIDHKALVVVLFISTCSMHEKLINNFVIVDFQVFGD